MVLLGFVALGIEGGRWYLVRAELAKESTPPLSRARKTSRTPSWTPTTLAEEFGKENFAGRIRRNPGVGAGSVRFTATMVEYDKISVTGNVNATATPGADSSASTPFP